MKFKIPILEEEMDVKTGEVTSKTRELGCELDFSIDSQTRWEENFPELSKTISLADYAEKFKNVKTVDVATAGCILKILYSYAVMDESMTFRAFTRLFTFSNLDYLDELVNTFKKVIDYISERNNPKKKS